MPVPDPIGPSATRSGPAGGGPTKIESLVSAIEQKLKELVNAVNAYLKQTADTLGRIPGIAETVAVLELKLSELVTQYVQAVTLLLEQSHAGTLMWMAAQTWGNVGNQTGQVSRAISQLVGKTGDWQGLAGPKYAKAANAQYSAISLYQSKADDLQNDCYTAVQTVETFYQGLLSLVTGFVIGAVAGGPIGAMVGTAAAALVALHGNVMQLYTSSVAVGASMQQIAQANGTFTGPKSVGTIGGWPQGTA
jgi:hypothetical protein